MGEPKELTLRDWLACEAMSAIIINSGRGTTKEAKHTSEFAGTVAVNAYMYADEMLKFRNRSPAGP